jgi:hypothetical protein
VEQDLYGTADIGGGAAKPFSVKTNKTNTNNEWPRLSKIFAHDWQFRRYAHFNAV